MGHLGLMPQSVHQLADSGGRQRLHEDAEQLLADAAHWKTRARSRWCWNRFRRRWPRAVTEALRIPTIGIGAGPYCDGQVLVSYDMLGLSQDGVPAFVKRYAELGDQTLAAARAYADDVRTARFPAPRVPRRPAGLAEDGAE